MNHPNNHPTPPSRQVEIRTIPEKVELRASSDGKQVIVGYAAKFNQRSLDLGGFVEQIDPGFFDGVMKDDVRALFNHNANIVLGRTEAGTCRLTVDALGLRYEIDPPDTAAARDLLVSMQRGDINQSSFSFMIDWENGGDSWEYDETNDIYLRTLLKCARLYDVSPVTYPAYEQTESVVSQRCMDVLAQKRAEKHGKTGSKRLQIMRKRLDLAEKA